MAGPRSGMLLLGLVASAMATVALAADESTGLRGVANTNTDQYAYATVAHSTYVNANAGYYVFDQGSTAGEAYDIVYQMSLGDLPARYENISRGSCGVFVYDPDYIEQAYFAQDPTAAGAISDAMRYCGSSTCKVAFGPICATKPLPAADTYWTAYACGQATAVWGICATTPDQYGSPLDAVGEAMTACSKLIDKVGGAADYCRLATITSTASLCGAGHG